MFDEMRNAINAAEDVINQLKWKKDSLASSLDMYNMRVQNGDELTDWELSDKKQYAIELDLIDEVEKHVMKWVKSQM